MTASESWPYIESYHKNESDKHLTLKNLAVYWLMQQGFSLSDIEDEYTVPDIDGRAYTDIHAKQGGIEVFIECETEWHSIHDLSKGGSVPAKNDELVLLFKDDGIYEIVHETVERRDKHTGEPFTTNRLRPHYLSDLPVVDLRAFKE